MKYQCSFNDNVKKCPEEGIVYLDYGQPPYCLKHAKQIVKIRKQGLLQLYQEECANLDHQLKNAIADRQKVRE